MPRLGLLMCAWRRRDLLKLALRHDLAAARAAGLDVVPVCVVSPDDAGAKEAVEAADWIAVEAPNSPLSHKWGAGLSALREYGVDAVTQLGSDDLVSASVFKSLALEVEHGRWIAGYLDFVAFRGIDQKCVHWKGYEGARAGDLIGTAKTWSRAILDAVDWTLWPEPMDRNLDGQARDRCRDEVDGLRKRISALRLADDELILDVKHDPEGVGIGRFEQFDGPEVDTAKTLALLGEETARALVELTDPLPKFMERAFCREITAGAAKPRVALVMIAKNSEATIALAIRGCMPVVDEVLVVVDEASTDRTEEIARAHGARVARGPWLGFGPQRNFAHSQTEAEWQIVHDADDTMEPGDLLEKIREAEELDADAVVVTVAASTQPGVWVPSLQPRVLRKGRFRWWGRRHNDIVGDLKTVRSTAIVRGTYHGTMPGKVSAMVPELVSMFESPSDPAVPPEREKAHAAFHLARAYMAVGDWAAARDWAKKCREIDATQPRRRHETVVAIEGWATLILDGFQAADWFVTDALREWPEMADLRFLRLSIDAPLCYTYALSPGRFASQPQSCLARLANFPQAMAMIGIGVEVGVAPAEDAADA